MPKRKQRDFQKTKLKVGRKVTKGGNITDTSFKTKKIIAPQQKFESLADKPLIELLGYLDTTNANQKKDMLKKIDKYIADNLDSLFLYFPDVLSRLGKVVLESDPELPQLAVDVITTCVGHLSEIQYQSFSGNMMLHLNVMMSHGAMPVRQASLKLLEALVTSHPKVLTGQTKILFSLLNMISKEKNGKRTLNEHVSRTMTSATWHQQVLQHVRLFLQELTEIEDNKGKPVENGKVYHAGKCEVFIPWYEMCGPKEVDMSWYTNIVPTKEGELEKFVKELLQVLFVLAKDASKRVQQESTSDGSLINKQDAKHLNMIVQLMCYIGEMNKVKFNFEENKEELRLFLEIISSHLMNGFPFEQHGRVDPNKITELDSYQLNLGICYLYTVFILDSGNNIVDKRMIQFLEGGIRAALNMTERSIILILKFSRTIIRSKHIQIELKNAVLVSIYHMLQKYRNSDYAEEIYSFFAEICLDYQYKDALQTLAMDSWLESLVGELTRMKQENTINTKLLKCIREFCCRKYPEFLKVLKEDHGEPLLELLKYDNQEFQSTILQMILAVDPTPSNSILSGLSELIYTEAISTDMSKKIILQLHTRFSPSDVSNKEKLLFVKFLLNVNCNVIYDEDPIVDEENPQFTDFFMQSYLVNTHRVYPTKKWGTSHKQIFEVCMQCLLTYYSNPVIQRGVYTFIYSFCMQFDGRSDPINIPVHTILAFLSMKRPFEAMFRFNYVIQTVISLSYSAFLYCSIVMTEAAEEAISYSVAELTELLLSVWDLEYTYHMIQLHEKIIPHYQDIEMYHFMKTLTFLKLHRRVDLNFLASFLQGYKARAEHSPMLLPIWRALCG